MSHQAIVYSLTSGRVRYVLDPEGVIWPGELAAKIKLQPGEGLLVRAKQSGQNRLHEWQAAVSGHCALVPKELHPEIHVHVHAHAGALGITLTEVPDRYEVVDAAGNVVDEIYADPAIDTVPGHSLRLK